MAAWYWWCVTSVTCCLPTSQMLVTYHRDAQIGKGNIAHVESVAFLLVRNEADCIASHLSDKGSGVVAQFEEKPSKRHSRDSGNPTKAVSATLELDTSWRWHDVTLKLRHYREVG